MRIFKLGLMVFTSLFFLNFGTAKADTVSQQGKASYYSNSFDGRRTANGEVFKNNLLTAASKTLPFGTIVDVTNLANGKHVTVRINDRGPFVKGRVIDLSKQAFSMIASPSAGLVNVKLQVLN